MTRPRHCTDETREIVIDCLNGKIIVILLKITASITRGIIEEMSGAEMIRLTGNDCSLTERYLIIFRISATSWRSIPFPLQVILLLKWISYWPSDVWTQLSSAVCFNLLHDPQTACFCRVIKNMKLTRYSVSSQSNLETKEVIIGWLFLLFPSSSKTVNYSVSLQFSTISLKSWLRQFSDGQFLLSGVDYHLIMTNNT